MKRKADGDQECLAKASALEERAAQCAEPDARIEFLEAAIRWRDLARRALVHEHSRALDT
ncbi:MAG: hypothetical protein QOG13_263 [Sphingomonadales bacterium]|jgi:hypothetical protein|nr:hypothetical protein [Sphingomonadales bacterium]